MSLSLVSDYIAQGRVLLQDKVQPYRYDDQSFIDGLNNAFLEMSKLRPDILADSAYTQRVQRRQALTTTEARIPTITGTGSSVPAPKQYQMALLYYTVGFVQLRDSEETQDSRASTFITRFNQILLGS